jgi:D-sedoheptulose 7-phosphate isomerase
MTHLFVAIREAVSVINRHLIDLAISLQGVDNDAPRLQLWGKRTAAALLSGRKLLICTTDGGAGQARHVEQTLAATGERLPVVAVLVPEAGARQSGSGQAAAGAAQNAAGAALVREQGERGDVLLFLANGAAGREEMAGLAREAGELGLITYGLTGPAPDPVADACTEAITVAAPGSSTVEEVHLAAIHIFCAAVSSEVRDAVNAGQAKPGSQPASAGQRTA